MHFSVLVLLKKGEDLEQVLSPFYSGDSVDEHDEKCWCISNIARRDISQKFNFDAEVKQVYHALPKAEQTNPLWRKMMDEHRAKELVALKAHPLFGKPDPACTECGGKGICKSTSNPDGHWDWYEEGGRWDGSLTNKKGKSVNRLKVKDYSAEKAELNAHKKCVEWWEAIQKHLEENKGNPEAEVFVNMTHGYDGEKTFQEYAVKHKPDEISAYAFLADGVWQAHEDFDLETCQHIPVEGWQEKLNKAIKELDPKDELVMVDCHN